MFTAQRENKKRVVRVASSRGDNTSSADATAIRSRPDHPEDGTVLKDVPLLETPEKTVPKPVELHALFGGGQST